MAGNAALSKALPSEKCLKLLRSTFLVGDLAQPDVSPQTALAVPPVSCTGSANSGAGCANTQWHIILLHSDSLGQVTQAWGAAASVLSCTCLFTGEEGDSLSFRVC